MVSTSIETAKISIKIPFDFEVFIALFFKFLNVSRSLSLSHTHTFSRLFNKKFSLVAITILMRLLFARCMVYAEHKQKISNKN